MQLLVSIILYAVTGVGALAALIALLIIWHGIMDRPIPEPKTDRNLRVRQTRTPQILVGIMFFAWIVAQVISSAGTLS